MVNYIFGVCWEDNFRLQMIVEGAATQAHSVTQKITTYTIHRQEGSPIDFTLTIIDAPGFGDTREIESFSHCPHLKVELIILMLLGLWCRPPSHNLLIQFFRVLAKMSRRTFSS